MWGSFEYFANMNGNNFDNGANGREETIIMSNNIKNDVKKISVPAKININNDNSISYAEAKTKNAHSGDALYNCSKLICKKNNMAKARKMLSDIADSLCEYDKLVQNLNIPESIKSNISEQVNHMTDIEIYGGLSFWVLGYCSAKELVQTKNGKTYLDEKYCQQVWVSGKCLSSMIPDNSNTSIAIDSTGNHYEIDWQLEEKNNVIESSDSNKVLMLKPVSAHELRDIDEQDEDLITVGSGI